MARIIRALVLVISALTMSSGAAAAQTSAINEILAENAKIIAKGSRKTIQPAIDALRDSGLPEAQVVLEKWRAKEIWMRKEDQRFFLTKTEDKKTYQLFEIASGVPAGEAAKKALKQIKPNSGVRALISAALVRFQLMDPNPAKRRASLTAIQRDPSAEQLFALRGAIADEPDADIKAEKQRIEHLLTLAFDPDPVARVNAIRSFEGALDVDVRAALNPLLATTTIAVSEQVPDVNIARRLTVATAPGDDGGLTGPARDLDFDAAYALLVTDGAPAAISTEVQKQALAEHVVDGKVGGIALSDLNSTDSRDRAYAALALAGKVAPAPSLTDRVAAIKAHTFYAAYTEPDSDVTDAAREVLADIETQVEIYGILDLSLDALSLASIYFLAAIGLAITFGVMRVINMAHGEFIMMGAYTGFVVQQIIPDYTISILVALPLAFAVTFGAGVALERLVIRYLYHRPLETLLATFGISIALQQIAKNIFGTQARPLTSPEWLDGAWEINPVVAISWIRVAIFVLGLAFLIFLLFVLNRTRLGLEVRAVTQNPRMAASMGIDPDRIRMLTFGLGSGIAGIAGVAIGLFAKVTSGLGQDYIVQSFMTVVVGGVGNLWGVLAGASLIGSLQKVIEAFNPSNTLAAQTYMIVFIIIFIQFRPKGIFALKGRAAGD
ncbi:MAG: urea ABC transporter permease subunit UrtB [Pseudomonadota bacterium]